MRTDLFTQILFIIYCVEAGVVLLLVPWGGAWERLVFQVPWDELRGMLLHPWLRSAVSGFGVVHLVWGAHDLDLVLSRRRRKIRSGVGR